MFLFVSTALQKLPALKAFLMFAKIIVTVVSLWTIKFSALKTLTYMFFHTIRHSEYYHLDISLQSVQKELL